MTRNRWRDLSTPERWVVVTMGVAQLGLAATAWVDLARRPQEAVNGRKPWWAVAIGVNFVGPIAYLRFGRVKSR